MAFPSNWNPLTDGPKDVQCPHCRQRGMMASNAWSLLPTGVIDHLYWCKVCAWCATLRYDPMAPRFYQPIDLIPCDKHGQVRKLVMKERKVGR